MTRMERTVRIDAHRLNGHGSEVELGYIRFRCRYLRKEYSARVSCDISASVSEHTTRTLTHPS